MLKKVNPNRYLPNFMCFFICGVIYANKLIREFLTLAFFPHNFVSIKWFIVYYLWKFEHFKCIKTLKYLICKVSSIQNTKETPRLGCRHEIAGFEKSCSLLTSAGRCWSGPVRCRRRKRQMPDCPQNRTGDIPHSHVPSPQPESYTGQRRSYWRWPTGSQKLHPDRDGEECDISSRKCPVKWKKSRLPTFRSVM